LMTPFAGILIIGLGDSAASIGGMMVGRFKWPGTKKTVEGTVFAFVSVMALAYWIQQSFDDENSSIDELGEPVQVH